MKSIIKIKNLWVAYQLGKSNEVWAAQDINLEIYPQEYVIFFGPSGSGKSTLLYVIAGLEKPTKGQVLVADHDLSTLSEKELMEYHRSTIGIIFQAFYLIPILDVKDNLLLPQMFTKATREEREQRVIKLAERFNITDRLDKRATELSGGQQQRVAAARALINDPEIILADEPVGNLDTKNAEITMQLLAELNEKDKKTVVLVTHDPRYLPYAHRVFHLQDGKIVRETRNPAKKLQGAPPTAEKQEISELEKLAQMHPYLDQAQLKAKLILNDLILPFDIDQQQHIEETIAEYLIGKISEAKMATRLHQSLEKGGADLYAQTAKKLVAKVAALKEEVKLVDATPPTSSKVPAEVIELRHFLLDGYDGHVTLEQVHLLDAAVLNLLKGEVDKKQFRKFLDMPLKKGGVGLNRRTAKNMTKALALILMDRDLPA